MNPAPRLHIGHHFFGSGNLGDDLMLAGFLSAIGSDVRLSCATPFDIASQRLRFPMIQWGAYDRGRRANAIDDCDAWVGVGDTPFQLVVGDWFYQHLADELALCRRYRKPMFFVGVGVNERSALDHPVAQALLEYASHIWTRDEQSTRWIAEFCGPAKVTAGADLAHAWLCDRPTNSGEPNVDAFVLNFEDSNQFQLATVVNVLENDRSNRWLAQEVRELAGSERAIWNALPQELRDRCAAVVPDYAGASLNGLVDSWGHPARLLTSRYHASLIGAWLGSRVVSVRRSDKVAGLVQQLELESVPSMTDASEVRAAMDRARPTPRDRLRRLAGLAIENCRDLRRHVERVTPKNDQVNRMSLASVEELESPKFRSFMSMMNAFAAAHGLRTFTNWSKVWEYPWLWHAGLAGTAWAGKRVVDLGSEISPMPWFLACLGASVRLLEVDEQWAPTWVALRDRLGVDVDWHIVKSEAIPVPDEWADVVTSLSVIEHQPNKAAAVAEVARALRPGGLFAVSFDICEPEMGMTFPEWNGRALTSREFEDEIWFHPAFGNTTRPHWEWEAAPAFKAWHLQSAPHHNYVVGAATLRKKA